MLDASVAVISPSLVLVLTPVDASTVALVTIELGSVDKEVVEVSMVDGSVVE